jgi:hypothetical protein
MFDEHNNVKLADFGLFDLTNYGNEVNFIIGYCPARFCFQFSIFNFFSSFSDQTPALSTSRVIVRVANVIAIVDCQHQSRCVVCWCGAVATAEK